MAVDVNSLFFVPRKENDMHEIYPRNGSDVSFSSDVLNHLQEAERRAEDVAKLAIEIGLPGIAVQDI